MSGHPGGMTRRYVQPARVLVVEDDPAFRDLLIAALRKADYVVDWAGDTDGARQRLGTERFDLVVLDVMLPGEGGLALCREISLNAGPPVILLTAVAEESDRVAGLDAGADDYVTKPFAPAELLARIRAVLRRAGTKRISRNVAFADWRFDTLQGELTGPDGVKVPLSAGEVRLMTAFVTQPGSILSREDLTRAMHNREPRPFERTIDIAVARLRRKIEEDTTNPRLLKTVRGGGYMLACSVRPL